MRPTYRPKMRICFDKFSTKQLPGTDKATRNLATNGVDSAVRKIPLKSPNKPPDQALLKGLSKKREFIQLIECYHLFLTYLTSPKGVSLDFKEYCTYRRNRKEILLKSKCKNPTCFCDQDMRPYLRSQPRGRDLREAGEVLRLK